MRKKRNSRYPLSRSPRSDHLPPDAPRRDAPPQVRYDQVAAINFEGTSGTVHLHRVDFTDGWKTITIKVDGVGAEGLELHWGCVYDGAEDWAPPPEDAVLPDDTRGFGDDIASRSPFVNGTCVISFPPDVGENVERIVGIVVRGEDWMHAESGDLSVPLKTPSQAGVINKLATAERPGHGSLYERFCRVNDALNESMQSGPGGAAAIAAVLRLSAIRQLPWYAGGNYQGKDMAHMQEVVCRRIADASATAEDGFARQFYRLALGTLPRGGGNGDEIRLGILQIMRENGIKEGHRPGIEDKFIGQWHQKLHSNTTVDDVYICEAYLHFLHTGDWNDFWTHLYENHGLTKEDLAGMKAGWRTEGIHGPAEHLPHMIDTFKHFLWILKITHGGGNLDSAMDFAHGNMPEDLVYEVRDMLAHRDEPWVPTKLVEIRERLSGVWRYGEHHNRDVVLLDIAMEKFYRQKIEAMVTANMSPDEKLGMLEMACRNACVGQDFDRMQTALAFFQKANGDASGLTRWSKEWAVVMDAALESVSLAMEWSMDEMCKIIQGPATMIGQCAECDPAYIQNFGEEIVRGHSMFAVSKLLGEVRGSIREAAGRSPWIIVSVGKPELSLHAGKVTVTALADIQGQDMSRTPSVIMSAKLGGLEDIPPGVTAVLTAAPVDLLSHIAIRARQMGVLLACMPDSGGWAELMSYSGADVKFDVIGEEILVKKSELGDAAAATVAGPDKGAAIVVDVTPTVESEKWVVSEQEYAEGVVGGKSQMLAKMSFSPTLSSYAMTSPTMVGSDVKVPSSCALPFGSFDKAINADEATLGKLALAAAAVAAADDHGDAKLRRDALEILREIIQLQLAMPAELATELTLTSKAYCGGGVDVRELYAAIKKVWASKWTERAYLSRKSCGVEEEELKMAALIMEVVPADYAFVIHTANPVSGDQGEIFGEVCVGLGEALVGNEPGGALSFTAKKTKGWPATIRSLPSKPVAHLAPEGIGTIIVRSDSNGEDLEGFAGAGLYDSVTVTPTTTKVVDYAEEPLIWDTDGKRTRMIAKLSEIACAIETEMGAPQDIEGCVVGENIYILQSRAQQL